MGQTTPNIGIYVPADGEQNYGQSFAAGMINIDNHDHSGGENKGLPITGAGLADFCVTYDKLNANVVDTTTGIGVNGAVNLQNQLQILGLLKNIYQISTATGFIAKNASSATARTITGTPNQIAVANGAGVSGDPTLSLPANVINPLQTAFNVGVDANQNGVTGAGSAYVVQFPVTTFYGEFQQGTAFNAGTGVFTAPIAGVYMFSYTVRMSGINAGGSNSTELSFMVNGSNQYVGLYLDSFSITNGDRVNFTISQVLKLALNDTVTCLLRVSNTTVTNIVNITDGNFSGCLLC